MKTLRKQCMPSLTVLFTAAMMFVPLPVIATASAFGMQPGLHAMTEADLASISAHGLTDELLNQSVNTPDSSNFDLRKTIGKLTSTINTRLNFLDGEVTLTDVAYDPTRAKTFANADGSITQILPSSIGEINFDHIRVKGAAPGPSFGSISIKDVNFNNTTLTLSPRR